MKDTFIDTCKVNMFVIPCKYNPKFPFVIELVQSIRKYHPTDKIVIVDSDSSDKSYFNLLKEYDIIIEDIQNKNWMIGAYWHTYKKYSEEDFYFFLHDSMIVKNNLDYLKERDCSILMYFDRTVGNFNTWGNLINSNSKYNYSFSGNGCFGPIFFCKNKVMKKMMEMGADKFLPSNKAETGYCEGCYGFFLEDQGYDLKECSLYGDVFHIHSSDGPSGLPPHKTSWQFPIEKFYASHLDPNRC